MFRSTNIAIIGLQDGDECKARWVDIIARKVDADLVVRWHGGANSGHTVYRDEKKFVFHQIPSAINSNANYVIGPGCAIDPIALIKDINKLPELKDIFVDYRCPVVLPGHIGRDCSEEDSRGNNKIGTTKRGIGPCYSDFFARKGLRFIDLLDLDKTNVFCNKEEFWVDFVSTHQDLFRELCCDTGSIVRRAFYEKVRVVFEGAQSIWLDPIHGPWPNVTSSICHPAGILSSFGLGFDDGMDIETYGVMKPYSTKVGSGPFPSEMSEDIARLYRENGGEYGATTGRPRKCGWLDIPRLREAYDITQVSGVLMGKYDVVFDEDGNTKLPFSVVTKYVEANGRDLREVDSVTSMYNGLDSINDIVPVYKTDITTYEDLYKLVSESGFMRIVGRSFGIGLNDYC